MQKDDIRSVSGADYGRSLTGFGVNILVRNIAEETAWLGEVLQLEVIRKDASFAVIGYEKQHFMLHVDASYAGNPLLSLVPETGIRGGGLELRLYDTDPDTALLRARKGRSRAGVRS
ncbi:MAG: hypothetical protein R3D29_12465 [Nitratireductor sp.]